MELRADVCKIHSIDDAGNRTTGDWYQCCLSEMLWYDFGDCSLLNDSVTELMRAAERDGLEKTVLRDATSLNPKLTGGERFLFRLTAKPSYDDHLLYLIHHLTEEKANLERRLKAD